MSLVVTDDEHYKGIAEEIRCYVRIQKKYKPKEMRQGVADTFVDGVMRGTTFEREDFWNAYQNYGNRRNYAYAFAGAGWKNSTFAPMWSIIVENGESMFRECGEIDDFVALLNFRGVEFDTSNAQSMYYAFAWSGIKHLGVIDSNGQNDLLYLFSQASELNTIDELKLRQNGGQTFTNTFSVCSKLENITISGLINRSINFMWSPLSVDSMKSIITHLAWFSASEVSTKKYTITFSDECWERLESSGPAPDGGTWRDFVMYKLLWNI